MLLQLQTCEVEVWETDVVAAVEWEAVEVAEEVVSGPQNSFAEFLF